MGPIWQYQRKIRMANTSNQAIIKKEDGTDCQGIEETIKRWEEWTKKNFSKEQEELIPKISHITEQEWEKKFIKPPEDIKQIRENSTLMKMMKKYPEIEEWLNRPYEEEDIMTEIKSLALKKAHGNDGIPGEAYKATMKWAVKPITKVMNLIKEGRAIPTKWMEGTIVYIYKNKGDASECKNYRPICLTQIIYKIWSGLITRKLTKIMHIITSNNQYGYKEGVSTIDAIIKVEQYIKQTDKKAKILLMDLSKAFDTINRTILWTTLYKKGIPEEMIRHIRRGHQGTTLAPKYKGKYGNTSDNNIGVFQGAAISPLMFIIYLDDMMEDLEALNRRTNLPIRMIHDRPHQQQEELLLEEIGQKTRNMRSTW